MLAADILVLSTPVWLGHPSSIAQRVLERLDADLSTTDDLGRPIMVDKVAAARNAAHLAEALRTGGDPRYA